jgi:hypothetical protein
MAQLLLTTGSAAFQYNAVIMSKRRRDFGSATTRLNVLD